jgi:pimeloyl-ACP methyl ester carboxylesterase
VNPDALVETIAATIVAAGLSGAPLLAFDLGCVVASRLDGAVARIDMERAVGWARRGFAPDGVAPRGDGAHLTSLFAHLRNAHLLAPHDGARASREGDALPDASALDRAVVSAAVDPLAYAELWRMLIGGLDATWPHVSGAGDFTNLRDVEDRFGRGPPARPLPPPARPQSGAIWRMQVDTPEARLHVRRAGGQGRALLVLQSAPGSTAPLARVIESLGRVRDVYAPDYPGNGCSQKIEGDVDIARLARAMLSAADSLGLDSFDLWGTHTGALVALEMALIAPARVGRLIMEAPPLLSGAFSADILANYLPALVPDRWGLYLQQAWNMRRDMFIFWPWYRAQREAIRLLGLPEVAMLHDWTIGLLQSGRTYDRSYRAAFEYPTRARLPLLARPALITAGPTDMLADALAEARGLCGRHVEIVATPATVWYPNQREEDIVRTLDVYNAFFERA